MIKKISLYFDPYAWESLHRLVSLLLVSGKPLNELPNMNDVIEGTVIYVSRMLERGSIDVYFLEYVQGYTRRKITPSDPSFSYKDKGRMALRMSEPIISAVKSIRCSRTLKSLKEDGEPSSNQINSISDAILIRSCVYYILDSPILMDFLMSLYMSNLFDIPPCSVYLQYESVEKESALIPNKVKDRLMMILWDQSIIFNLLDVFRIRHSGSGIMSEHLQNRKFMDKSNIISYGDTPDLAFQSKAFHFNYLSAMYGWLILGYFEYDISEVTILKLITNFLDKYDTSKRDDKKDEVSIDTLAVQSFLRGLENIFLLAQYIHLTKSNKKGDKQN